MEIKLIEGEVNRQGEHMQLYYGSDGDSVGQKLVGLVEKMETAVFKYQILDSDYTKYVMDDLRFYLVEHGPYSVYRDAWKYAKYHCTTASNIYSDIHWNFFDPKEPKPIHDYESKIVDNKTLTTDDVPPFPLEPSDSDWDRLQHFCLSFDGYKYWGKPEIAREIFKKKDPRTLSEYRTCLFMEQRQWHHWGFVPRDPTSISYIIKLLEGTREKISKKEFE